MPDVGCRVLQGLSSRLPGTRPLRRARKAKRKAAARWASSLPQGLASPEHPYLLCNAFGRVQGIHGFRNRHCARRAFKAIEDGVNAFDCRTRSATRSPRNGLYGKAALQAIALEVSMLATSILAMGMGSECLHWWALDDSAVDPRGGRMNLHPKQAGSTSANARLAPIGAFVERAVASQFRKATAWRRRNVPFVNRAPWFLGFTCWGPFPLKR